MLSRYDDHAVLLLRVALGGIFLYFGFWATIDPASQVFWLADWAPALLKTLPFIIAFGVLQLLLGAALVLGVYPRFGALLAALLLAGIIINVGPNEVALRDLVILTAALVLATRPRHAWALRVAKLK